MIYASELTDVDEDLALRVIATARSIAPGIDDIPQGEGRKTVLAIIRAAAREGMSGPRGIADQRVGSAAVTYRALDSWFSADDKASLRAICNLVTGTLRSPIGSFPRPANLGAMWPEQYD